MSLDQQMYGSTDWHLPSPSSTPKSGTFPDASFKTPKTEAVSQSSFLEAWSTPRVNGHQTPAQTPSISLSTPIDRPSSAYSQNIRSPEDPEFHVNYLASNNLPLPPVDPSRRLSSSPSPLSAAGRAGTTLREHPSVRSRPVSMDTSQMQTPPPTRDASSRRNVNQQTGNNFATPATVISRTPLQAQPADNLFNQTPFGHPSLQFSPDTVQFPSTEPLSAPPLPHSRLFWNQSDMNNMDVDMPLASDPFGSTPFKIEPNMDWRTFQTPVSHMNTEAFQAVQTVSSPGNCTSFAARNAPPRESMPPRPSSSVSTSVGIDPSMVFSFSSPPPATSFGRLTQPPVEKDNRQPYEMQTLHSLREREEREMAKKSSSQHSRTSTSSSVASLENRPGLQRSLTDSGFRKSRPSSMDGKPPTAAAGFNIPRRTSPLKRQSGGSLTSIPEARRPRTRLVIDSSGRARTETIAVEDAPPRREAHVSPQKSMRQQYPELYNNADSDSDTDEEPVMLSRNSSFNLPQRRPGSSKHARTDSGGLERTSSLKMPRPSSGFFSKPSDTVRPVRRAADNPNRRFSMMDFPTSFGSIKQQEDQEMPDSPGDALGALKKVVVEDRQKRIERSAQNTLKAHNQRWAQGSADINSGSSPHGQYDPFGNSFSGSPATNTDAGFTTPSTDRSSISIESTRCICNSTEEGRLMVQCESCNKWLHMNCIGYTAQNLPPVYVCVFCTGNTPVARGGRVRGPMPTFDSPLTHKSVFRR